jgi:hypothetical protein
MKLLPSRPQWSRYLGGVKLPCDRSEEYSEKSAADRIEVRTKEATQKATGRCQRTLYRYTTPVLTGTPVMPSCPTPQPRLLSAGLDNRGQSRTTLLDQAIQSTQQLFLGYRGQKPPRTCRATSTASILVAAGTAATRVERRGALR